MSSMRRRYQYQKTNFQLYRLKLTLFKIKQSIKFPRWICHRFSNDIFYNYHFHWWPHIDRKKKNNFTPHQKWHASIIHKRPFDHKSKYYTALLFWYNWLRHFFSLRFWKIFYTFLQEIYKKIDISLHFFRNFYF